MNSATDERAMAARIERLERAVRAHLEVDRAILKAQCPSVEWPGHATDAAQAMRKLNEAIDLLKPEGDPT